MKQLSVVLSFMLLVIASNVQAQSTYIWKPVGSSTSAKVPGNWKISTCNGSVATVLPSTSDTLLFSNCSSNNAVLDTNLNVAFISVKSNYSGTITGSGSFTITAAKMKVSGGMFTGGSNPITINGTMTVDGGTFTSTSGILTVRGNFSNTGGTFTHNSGTVKFQNATTGQLSVSSSSKTTAVNFYNVIFDASDTNATFRVSNMLLTVNHSLEISGDEQLFINGDTILMTGTSTLTLSNTSNSGGGTSKIKFNGSSTQSITGNSGTDYTRLPNLIITKSGTLNLSGNIAIGGSSFLDYHGGTISEGNSSFLFYYNDTIKGAMTFHDVEFAGHSSNFELTDTISINHDLKLSGTAYTQVNNGGIKVFSNLVYENSHSSSVLNTSVQFANVSVGQNISGSNTIKMTNLKMKGNNLVLHQVISVSHTLYLSSGYISTDATNILILTSTCSVVGGSSASFVKGPMKKIGNTAFTFPLGGGSSYKPLTISEPSSSTDAYIAEYFNNIQPLGLGRSSLTYTSMCEYWNLYRTVGSSNVTVKLSWDPSSCDIYTLSTLKIGRWNGTVWADVGIVSTTGNTTSGTIVTSSSQSSFGSFLIAKNSPAVTANAGSNATINLGQSTTIGGSPSASNGTTPYTYEWITDYGLSSASVANPSASPFSSREYTLKVTDADLMVDIDEVLVTVNGFELDELLRFPLLADGSITVSSPLSVVGAVGSNNAVDDDISASDHIFISTTEVSDALSQLDDVMSVIDGLSASSISASLGSHTYTSGVYRISGNATLNGTVTLSGDKSSYFVIDIGGTLAIANGASVVLDGVTKEQVFFRVSGDIYIPSGSATLNGYFFGSEDFTGTVAGGKLSIQVKGLINGTFPKLLNIYIASLTGTPRTIAHFLGYNGTNTTKGDFGWGTDDGFAKYMPALSPSLLRYPGGTVSNWWNWQTGWFRGYNNPLYNSYLDEVPLPTYATDGLPWDNNAAIPLPDNLTDFKEALDACAAFPVLNLNLLTSDIGTQIGELFATRCMDIPTKYIELGNEFYLNGVESAEAFPQPSDYANVADSWAQTIKDFFPDVKIAAVAASSKTNISNPPDRRNYWNTNGTFEDITGLFANDQNMGSVDALTFHIYPWIGLKEDDTKYHEKNIDAESYQSAQAYEGETGMFAKILAEPFRLEKDLEEWNSATESQPEFDADNEATIDDKEIWVTEFNQEEDYYNFRGRWLHSLFDAGLAMGFLSNPDVTHIVCQTMFSKVDQGAYFSDTEGYPPGEGYPITETTQWGMSATGYGLKYLAAAMKNTYYAKKITFSNTVPQIFDVGEQTSYDGLLGWMFSDGEDFTVPDSLIGVIVNFTDNGIDINVSDIFPNGGKIWEMTTITSDETVYEDARKFIIGDEDIESSPVEFANVNFTIKPYTILLIRGNKQSNPYPGTIHAETSNSSICSGGENEATIYVSGSFKYYITPPDADGNSIVLGPTIKVKPTSTSTYTIYGTDGQAAWNPETVTINVSVMPTFDIDFSNCGITPCICPGDAQVIELESTSEDLLYNWMPRGENDFITQVNSTNFLLTVYPVTTTTYTINATDGICYCSQSTITAIVSEPADAGPDVWVCSDFANDEDVFVGYVPEDNLGYHDFVWSYASGTLSDDQISHPNFSSLPTTTTTYTLTEEGQCESEDEMTVNVINCCEGTDPDFVFDPYDPSYAQGNYLTAYDFVQIACSTCTPIDNGEIGFSPDDYVELVDYTGEIVINGPFYINCHLLIEDCTNINFGEKAEIIIEPNGKLDIKGSTLKAGCGVMWRGIREDANLNEDNGLIIRSTSTIQDAELAISATRDSRLDISHSDFFFNHGHLKLDDYRFDFAGVVNNNNFSSTGYLDFMLTPYDNVTTDTAILLNDIPSTASNNGTALFRDNEISDANFGLYAIWSGMVVEANTIDHTTTGILTKDAQNGQNITGSVITNSNNGIEVFYTNGEKTEILGNTITTIEIGLNNDGKGISVVDDGTSKITIGGYNSGEPNLINSNARYGIKIGGANEICDIFNNTVHLKQSATDGAEVWGIWVDDSHKTDVIDNTIDGDQGGTVVSLYKRAITLTASPGNTVSCNHTDNTEKGLEFLDDCSNSKIRANTMEEHTDGLAIGSSYPTGSEIGNQLMFTYQNTDYVPGDYWKGNGTAHSIDNETHIYDNLNAPQFQVPDNTYLSFYNPVNNINNIGTPISPTPQLGIPPYDDCESSVGFTNEDLDLDFDYILWESIADNSYGYGYREAVLSYNLKKSLFEQIKKNDDLMRDHSILEDFYDATKDQVIGSFNLVDSLIGLLSDTSIDEISKEFIVESALSENDAVDATQIFELNEQAFNHIYLNSIAKHAYPFDIGTEDALFDIASQCPYDGGKSVFKARNLYSLINPGYFFDDTNLCDTTGSPRITNQKQRFFFNVYPNPTSNTVAISYTITDHLNVDFVVENILNETIYKVRVNLNNTLMSLDFKDQAAGVYLFKFQEESAMLGSGKIIVIH